MATTPAIVSLLSFTSFYSRATSAIPVSYAPNFTPKLNPRLTISLKPSIYQKRSYRIPSCCCSNTDDSSKESHINIQLPRRSLLVQFTCDACGERTKRLINRLAYERGTVFVQCAGCLQHHKLIDNLGLVVEYDFRDDADQDQDKYVE